MNSINSQDDFFDLAKKVRSDIWDYVTNQVHKDSFNEIGNLHEKDIIKGKLEKIKGVPSKNIFLGSEWEHICDLLIRCFCNPGIDSLISVSDSSNAIAKNALLHQVKHIELPLNSAFEMDLELLAETIDDHTKLLFVSSPDILTGRSIYPDDLELILNNFNGLVVLNESYINFSRQRTFISQLTEYSNLVIFQSFSKAWGLADLGVGFLFGSEALIKMLEILSNSVQLNSVTIQSLMGIDVKLESVNKNIQDLASSRNLFVSGLSELPLVAEVIPSDADFVWVQFKEAEGVYAHLLKYEVNVEFVSEQFLRLNYLKIKIGTKEESVRILEILKEL